MRRQILASRGLLTKGGCPQRRLANLQLGITDEAVVGGSPGWSVPARFSPRGRPGRSESRGRGKEPPGACSSAFSALSSRRRLEGAAQVRAHPDRHQEFRALGAGRVGARFRLLGALGLRVRQHRLAAATRAPCPRCGASARSACRARRRCAAHPSPRWKYPPAPGRLQRAPLQRGRGWRRRGRPRAGRPAPAAMPVAAASSCRRSASCKAPSSMARTTFGEGAAWFAFSG